MIYLYNMKILLTENQIKLIEQEDKIDQYVHDLTELNIKFKKYFDQNYNIIVSLTILDCMNDMEKMLLHIKSMEQTKRVVENKHDFYFNIIDGYGVIDQPGNVRQLEKLVDELDEQLYKFSDLINALEGIIDSAKYLKK